jgi:hypothetical protein
MVIKILTNSLFKSLGQKQRQLLLLTLMGTLLGVQNLPVAANPSGIKPVKSRPAVSATVAAAKPPVLLGLYTSGFVGESSTIKNQLSEVDQWAGKHASLAGMFLDIEGDNPGYNVPVSLEQLRENGYTAFINLKSNRTAAEIARGDVDDSVRNVAKAYAEWLSKGNGRMAFIAPMQEMNIAGERYSLDPENFKLAYQRIQSIFAEVGVPRNAVRWVFAPNGWSQQGNEFEKYYPGSDRVDVVGFSAYNWGYCSSASWKEWSTNAADAFEPYIQRMRSMAPQKPIFITQTASTSNTQSGANSGAKDKWFKDAYAYLAAAPNVQAILYFNLDKECDWALHRSNGSNSEGYKNAIINPAFGYVSPDDLSRLSP